MKSKLVKNDGRWQTHTLTVNDLQEIRLLDTGRNVTGWPLDALKYNPKSE